MNPTPSRRSLPLSAEERAALARVLALPSAKLDALAAALRAPRDPLPPISASQRLALRAALPYDPSPVSAAQLRALGEIPRLAAPPAHKPLGEQAALYDALAPLASEARAVAQSALGGVGLIDAEIDDLTERLQAHLQRRLAEPLPPEERAALVDKLRRLRASATTQVRSQSPFMDVLGEELELFRMARLRELIINRLRDDPAAASDAELHGIAAVLTEEPEVYDDLDSA